MYDLVGNPEDRFSHNEAQILTLCMASVLRLPARPVPSYREILVPHPCHQRLEFQLHWQMHHHETVVITKHQNYERNKDLIISSIQIHLSKMETYEPRSEKTGLRGF